MEFRETVRKNVRTSEGLLKFSGRSNRTELFWYSIFAALAISISYIPFLLVALVVTLAALGSGSYALAGIGSLILGRLALVTIVFGLVLGLQFFAVVVRRLHDVGRSG